jgi:anti-sigma regulatory factor (Ser/Thr protein kinase)
LEVALAGKKSTVETPEGQTMPGSGLTAATNLKIPARPDAGAIARKAISAWMGGHPRLDDALLAVTELVNNAVLHGGLADGEELTVAIGPEQDGIRLTVRHVGALFDIGELSPPSREPGASRGLAIVERIADRWGVDSDGIEVSAWFEVGPGVSEIGSG